MPEANAETPVSNTMKTTADPLMQFFQYAHHPAHLQVVSQRFSLLADEIVKLPRNPERTVALRKLLEAKDCAVRAVIFKP